MEAELRGGDGDPGGRGDGGGTGRQERCRDHELRWRNFDTRAGARWRGGDDSRGAGGSDISGRKQAGDDSRSDSITLPWSKHEAGRIFFRRGGGSYHGKRRTQDLAGGGKKYGR